MHIQSVYKQYIQTAHPDLILEVPFRYKAIVHENEEVEVIEILDVDGNTLRKGFHGAKSNNEDFMHRFLANIREHARSEAYKRSKQNQSNEKYT